jgi:hypothetical protein
MRFALVLPLAIGSVLVPVAFAQEPPFKPSVILLDGQSLPLADVAIDEGQVSGSGLPAGLEIDDLREMRVAPVAASRDKPGIQVVLVGGGRLSALSLTIADDKCRLSAVYAQGLIIPLERVRAIRLDASPLESFDKAIAAPPADLDRIFLRIDDKVESAGGVTVGMTDEEFLFDVEGTTRKVPRSRLYGIVVAQPNAADEPPYVLITLRDGSTLPGRIEKLAGGTLTLDVGASVDVPWSAVAGVSIRSRRIAYLSELKPIEVQQRSIAVIEMPWQRDRSVMGRTLTLAGRTFAKGIGVHAMSRLTFDTGEGYDELAAVIGIDAETGGKGDCIFTVLADGEVLYSRRMKGTDPPQELKLDIRGKKQVTLLVEAGAGLDLADHADWCDVRFIRKREG